MNAEKITFENKATFVNGYSAELTEDGLTLWHPNGRVIMDASWFGTDATIRLSKNANTVPIEGEE